MDMFWTPGWGALMTLVGTLGGVAITAFANSRNLSKQLAASSAQWQLDARERHRDKLREALAELLALNVRLHDTITDVWLRAGLVASQGVPKTSIGQFMAEPLGSLHAVSQEVLVALTRARLLTSEDRVIWALDTLSNALDRARTSYGAPPEGVASGDSVAQSSREVAEAFEGLSRVAAQVCTIPNSESSDVGGGP